MELKIEYGIDFELSRVKNTLAKLDWYNSQRYRPRLPEGINKESSKDEIQEQIKEEFKEENYEIVATKVVFDFSKVNRSLSKKLKEIFDKEIPEKFIVYLTNYGVGGSYNLPNLVIFNINGGKGFKTIVHEIIHLVIENWIKKYNIQHWEKERIVDLILNSKEFGFLDYNNWQRDYRDVEIYIDDLFNDSFFGDPEKFFSNIENVRQSPS